MSATLNDQVLFTTLQMAGATVVRNWAFEFSFSNGGTANTAGLHAYTANEVYAYLHSTVGNNFYLGKVTFTDSTTATIQLTTLSAMSGATNTLRDASFSGTQSVSFYVLDVSSIARPDGFPTITLPRQSAGLMPQSISSSTSCLSAPDILGSVFPLTQKVLSWDDVSPSLSDVAYASEFNSP
jgi:hypothetical protein